MSTEKLFTAISDGEWHSLDELSEQAKIPIAKLIKCALLLSQMGIISYQKSNQTIRIEPEWKILLPDEALIPAT